MQRHLRLLPSRKPYVYVALATKVISRLEKEFNVNYKIDRGIIGPLDIRVWEVTNNVIEDWLD
ncbi:hypothetical protein [Proteus phage 2]|nr:hypothetical protein [Proteus phage 2]